VELGCRIGRHVRTSCVGIEKAPDVLPEATVDHVLTAVGGGRYPWYRQRWRLG
jgi:hypothetical protein